MKRLFTLCALLTSVLVTQPSTAQFALTPQMQKYLASPAYSTVINAALNKLAPEVFQRCPGLASPGSKVVPLQMIAFGPDGAPTAGAWKQMFPISGCGNDTVLNFIFSVGQDGMVHTLTLVPGYTRADPTLQRDSLFYANLGAARLVPECKNWVVKNTRFEAYGWANPATPDPGEGAKTRLWWETWVMAGCGHVVEVPIDFSPQEKGGTNIVQGGGKIVTP